MTAAEIEELMTSNEHIQVARFLDSRKHRIYSRSGNKIIERVYSPSGILESVSLFNEGIWLRK